MSRSPKCPCNGRAQGTRWLRLALSLQLGALLSFNSIGCHTVGNTQQLSSNVSDALAARNATRPETPVPAHSVRPPSGVNISRGVNTSRDVNTSRGVSMSLNDTQLDDEASLDNAARPNAAAQGVALIAYEEPVAVASERQHPAAVAVNPQYDAAQGPIATLASCRVSGSCAPATSTAGCGCGGSGCNTCTTTLAPGMNVQEYIFDGGDLDPALVVRRDWSVGGLNPTDTVAHYETYDGKLCVTPTNRVPIYAPRFAAVRQITGAVISDHAVATERILAPLTPGRFDDTNLANTVMHPVAPRGEERVSLIDAFRDRNLGIPIAQVLPPQRISDAILPFEFRKSFGAGMLQEQEIAVIGQFLQNARTWVTPESLQILIDDQQVSEQLDIKRAQDIHVYELPPGKCTLRICKAASHMVANSGDTISFTIRFDNAGAHPIGKVVILDSLSPRLEYIEDSQQSSASPTPKFSVEPNEVGSTVLRWELERALQPGEGGVIHFRCLVR